MVPSFSKATHTRTYNIQYPGRTSAFSLKLDDLFVTTSTARDGPGGSSHRSPARRCHRRRLSWPGLWRAWRQILGREGLRWGFAGEKAGPAEEEGDSGGRARTTCFAGKASFCWGRERSRWLLSSREAGDKGDDNKAGRARALQPRLVPQFPTR